MFISSFRRASTLHLKRLQTASKLLYKSEYLHLHLIMPAKHHVPAMFLPRHGQALFIAHRNKEETAIIVKTIHLSVRDVQKNNEETTTADSYMKPW